MDHICLGMDTIRVERNTQTKAISSEVSDATVKKASLFLDKKTDGVLRGFLGLTSHIIHGAYNRCPWWSVSKL